ncbi:transposase [Streptomyces goshikiensis]|uniref:transposase n=1 Tax=Streptomyces goshikiensis TaxID=1942 RepID=UPI00367F3EBD
MLPVSACRLKTGGRPEKWHRREIADAIRYVVDNGIKWRALPADYPPWQTVSTTTSGAGTRPEPSALSVIS